MFILRQFYDLSIGPEYSVMQTTNVLIFWILLFVIFYSFLGYGIFLWVIVKVKRMLRSSKLIEVNEEHLPDVTLVIASFNEEDFIRDKIHNSLALDYPKDLLKILIVTDGSDDRTPDIVQDEMQGHPQISHYHEAARNGKLHAVDRIYPFIDTSIIVFTDANTILNKEAIRKIVRHYANEKVGGVSGEKRIMTDVNDQAAGVGEGFYWKYESMLKRLDYELYSVVGAAGELFSVRRELYVKIPEDSIVEDFFLTMRIAEMGHRVAYEPEAYARETGSASTGEELKRKIRIAAGGIQSIIRLRGVLNPFKHGILTFQYVSHRVLRWTVTPWFMIALLVLNYIIRDVHWVYTFLLYGQIAFYFLAVVGYLLQSRQIKIKPFFIPYYFCMMNYAVIRGTFRYFSGRQSAVWERAKRA